MKRIALLACLSVLSACGRSGSDPGPGGVTAGEARALDEAAAMLDERKPPGEAQTEVPQDEASGGGE